MSQFLTLYFSSFVYSYSLNITQVKARFVAFTPTRMQLQKVFKMPSALSSRLSKNAHRKRYKYSETVQ